MHTSKENSNISFFRCSFSCYPMHFLSVYHPLFLRSLHKLYHKGMMKDSVFCNRVCLVQTLWKLLCFGKRCMCSRLQKIRKTPFIIYGKRCNGAVTNKITAIFRKNNEFLSKMNHVNHLAFATRKTQVKSKFRVHSIEAKKIHTQSTSNRSPNNACPKRNR
jgi:hypothetical protein